MKVVHKFQFPSNEPNGTFNLPADAKIVHAAVQHGVIALWVEVFVDNPGDKVLMSQRTFRAIPTGFLPIEDDARHLATLISNDGGFVMHLYETTGVAR